VDEKAFEGRERLSPNSDGLSTCELVRFNGGRQVAVAVAVAGGGWGGFETPSLTGGRAISKRPKYWLGGGTQRSINRGAGMGLGALLSTRRYWSSPASRGALKLWSVVSGGTGGLVARDNGRLGHRRHPGLGEVEGTKYYRAGAVCTLRALAA